MHIWCRHGAAAKEIQMEKGLSAGIKLKWDVRVELGVEMREIPVTPQHASHIPGVEA